MNTLFELQEDRNLLSREIVRLKGLEKEQPEKFGKTERNLLFNCKEELKAVTRKINFLSLKQERQKH